MKRWFFDQVHRRNLIYNQCWEDPRIDNEALDIEPDDRIVMITRAGCNALDYLLSLPQRIDCVDMNPHQTALLELKVAALRHLDHDQFFAMFWVGKLDNHRNIYQIHLRPHLSESAQVIWDRRIDYFDSRGCGFYYHGTSGAFARVLRTYIEFRSMRPDLDAFQEIGSLEEQGRFYRERIAPRLWSPPLRWLMRQPWALSSLGIPTSQIDQMLRSGVGEVGSFIEKRVEHMFTAVPIRDNYFWRVYINGYHTPDCCPNYLKPGNFHLLRKLSSRLRANTTTLTDFLRVPRGPFSVFVLMDHMDWLADSPGLLLQEWNCILRTAQPGARIIYRSGGSTFDHVPDFAQRLLVFQPELTRSLNERDRVGTYGSFHLARLMT